MDALVAIVASLSVASLIACVMSARTVSKQAFQQRKMLNELQDSNLALRQELDVILATRGRRQLKQMYAAYLINSPYRTADAPPHCHDCGRPHEETDLDGRIERGAVLEHVGYLAAGERAALERIGYLVGDASYRAYRRRSEPRDVEDAIDPADDDEGGDDIGRLA
jgi:hypothetical protein